MPAWRAATRSASCATRIPCRARSCARGEWDMCQNGHYTEHGIKGLHGFAAERYRVQPQFVVKVDPKLGESGSPARADQHRGQGVGSHRSHRGARTGSPGACW